MDSSISQQSVIWNVDSSDNEVRLGKSTIEHETITENVTSHKEKASSSDTAGHGPSKRMPNDLDFFSGLKICWLADIGKSWPHPELFHFYARLLKSKL